MSGAAAGGAPVRIALIGMGRMGRALDALAPERGCEVVARLDAAEMSNGISAADLHGAQVAIEFTTPESSVANAIALLQVGCPVVIGTTGWSSQLPAIEAAAIAAHGAALWSPNFSIGVQLFLAMAEDAAARARQLSGFDVHVVETHHIAKLDAPSGTGIAIADRLREGLGREVPITSVRTGSVPGTHEVMFDAPCEQIRLVHEARDRRVFADGALTAARWLAAARAPGVYTMRDVLASSQAIS